jgi:diguanylate cyclase (GGDEF)-like protein
VARVGGDEFVLLFEHPGSPEEFRVLLEALKRSIDVPAPVGNLECVVGLSTGVAWFPLDGESADDLMRAADQRMYGDKRQRNRIRSKARS